MTEETIEKLLKEKYSAKVANPDKAFIQNTSLVDSACEAIKQLLEQHEAEMVEAMNWISEDGWVKYKGVDRWKNDSEIALFGVLRTKKYKLQPQTTTDLLTLFKNRNK